MWLRDDDLIKFALDIEKYIKEKLIFIRTDYDYPVAKLGDIKLYFNHCKTDDEANLLWNKRIKRINKKNMFVIVSDRCGMDKKILSSFEAIPCMGKVMFTSDSNRTEPYMLYLPYYAGEKQIGVFMNERLKNYWTVAPFDGVFDYVHFFNSGEINHRNSLRMKVLSYFGNAKWKKWIDKN